MSDSNRDTTRTVAAAYRASLVGTGAAQQRAAAEAAQAGRLESKAAGLRADAQVDEAKGQRRLRPR